VTSCEGYLEKIAQVSFDLPPISEQTMTLMISEAIGKIPALSVIAAVCLCALTGSAEFQDKG
jgi:hypothetical protein